PRAVPADADHVQLDQRGAVVPDGVGVLGEYPAVDRRRLDEPAAEDGLEGLVAPGPGERAEPLRLVGVEQLPLARGELRVARALAVRVPELDLHPDELGPVRVAVLVEPV